MVTFTALAKSIPPKFSAIQRLIIIDVDGTQSLYLAIAEPQL